MRNTVFRPCLAGNVMSLLLACLAGISQAEDFTAYDQHIAGTELAIAMVPVSGGTFSMGSDAEEPGHVPAEGPRHTVKVDDFWIGQYEIT